MKKISIEYCHITPGVDCSDIIAKSNEVLPRILEKYKDHEVQTCIMVDDIHAKIIPTKDLIKEMISGLHIQPDCVYLESSFVKLAKVVVADSNIGIKGVDDRNWLKEENKKYKTKKEFLLHWQADGSIHYSCPSLAATSYLFRLNVLQGGG